MAHEITETDSLVLRHDAAWHGLGTIIDEDVSAVDACERYGLGWDVDGWPLLTRNPETGELIEVSSHVANVREIDTPEGRIASVLGVVGSSYQVCQNRELAEFMDALAQTGDVVIETAGSIRGGKRVWFLARSDAYSIGSDKTYSYLLGSNAHDGSGSIRLDPTDVRVVCANTLRMVVPDAADFRGVQEASISIRHSGKLTNKLEAAKAALAEYDAIKRRHREVVAEMAEKRIDRQQALQFFARRYSESFATADNGDRLDPKVEERRRQKMDRAAAAFLARFDRESRQFGGESAWLALNAWTGYCQHDLRSAGKTDAIRHENRVRSNLFGDGARRTSLALQEAIATFLAV